MNAPLQRIDLIEPTVLGDAPARVAQLPATQSHGNLVVTPADLLRIAMDSGDKDLDRLERLMAMEERYRESQERERQRAAELAFRRDFAAFRGENIVVPKTKHVDRGKGGSFDQAEYDVVVRMLSPALSKHGFGFRHDQKFTAKPWTKDGVVSDEPWVIVTCYLEHRDGFRETLTLEGPPGDLTVNTPVQNMQVTGSFLKRQSLLAITGTPTGGEDDEARMRRSGGDARHEDPSADEALLDAGRAAAMEGMAALTAWWGALDAKARGRLSKEFGAMRKAAMRADEGAGHG